MRYIIRSVAAELAERTDSAGSRPTVKCCHMDRAVAHADLVTRPITGIPPRPRGTTGLADNPLVLQSRVQLPRGTQSRDPQARDTQQSDEGFTTDVYKRVQNNATPVSTAHGCLSW